MSPQDYQRLIGEAVQKRESGQYPGASEILSGIINSAHGDSYLEEDERWKFTILALREKVIVHQRRFLEHKHQPGAHRTLQLLRDDAQRLVHLSRIHKLPNFVEIGKLALLEASRLETELGTGRLT